MTTFAPGTFRPAPAAGRKSRMLLTQARTETLLALRNGEQVLLTLLIPLALLVGLTVLTIVPMTAPRVDSVTPRVLALAIMSSAFTSQAIALGFDRRYGVLKRLAATAIPRWLIVGGRMTSAAAVVVIQLVVLCVVAALLGWHPHAAGIGWAVLLVILGTLAFGALGVLLGGALRAEIVLALANIIWFVLLLAGGAGIASSLPRGAGDALLLLPSGALAEGLYTALGHGATPLWESAVVLLVWGAVAAGIATRTTKLT
ncbi:MAG TPA: ABC transporter permease [Pseudonocardiaceae bacterium]|jgi:ABC-2 type transport system permease protein|nr:ABC transporter permease [Pseudonocardiaceae bacterium]